MKYQVFADALREEIAKRQKEDITLYRIAKDSGVPQATIYRLMGKVADMSRKTKDIEIKNRNLSLKSVSKLVAYLGMEFTFEGRKPIKAKTPPKEED